ncbi:DedA family protein [Methanobrevibacter wolinii]|uniref:DedA family protein n=1 Tax=Methanobrevibacter wolinii TaxID=190977 RepID=UPI000A062789|nr:DedA family protein [Methanobrevibacter wolinii]MDD5959791.1 DedA family protein [Methanobrevibacter wolinii]
MSISASLANLVIYLIESLGYFGIFLGMTIESACIPLPSEVIMTFAGFVVNEGKLTLTNIILVGILGNLVGSLITYYIGLKGARPLLEKYGKYILITKEKLDNADKWFNKHGDAAVFFGRILPGIRTFISLPAGINKMDIKKFIIYTLIGSGIWTSILAIIGIELGKDWSIISQYFRIFDIIIGIAILLIIIYYVIKHRKNKKANKY